jgi:hypothetical protein
MNDRDATTSRLQLLGEGAVQRLTLRLQTLEEGAVQRLDTLYASMKAGEATTSDIAIRLQALEDGAAQRIDTLCASMEARDATTADIATRLKIVAEGAVLQEKRFQADLVAFREQHVEDLSELRNEFNKKQTEELLEIRNEQEKQEVQAERLVSIVTDLEQLFLCTKRDLQLEQLNATWQDKFNELRVWANGQVQSLETELADLRSSLDKCLPLGTLVREMQSSMSENKRCHDSFEKKVRNDLEVSEQGKDKLHKEIVCLKSDFSGLDQKLVSYMIQIQECKEHQEKRLSQAESDASIVMQSFEDVHAVCVALDQKLENYMIQIKGCKEHHEERLSQAESSTLNVTQCPQDAPAFSFVPATDPTGRSQIACLDADLGLLRSAFEDSQRKFLKFTQISNGTSLH